jgi:pimeloyl-ACP methyl ester carboxylesterase
MVQRLALGSLELVPDIGERALSALFFMTPSRLPVRPEEASVLARAIRHDVKTPVGTVAAYAWGEGPRVVLVHGYGGRASQLTPYVDPLLAQGFSVIAYDAPGHGASSGSSIALPEVALALHGIVAHFGAAHAVIAHSVGGAATCLAVHQGLPTARVALVAPPADLSLWFTRFAEGLHVPETLVSGVRRQVELRLKAPLSTFNAEAIGDTIKVPMLVVHDDRDREVPYEHGERVAKSVPRGSIVKTTGLGHRRILSHEDVVGRVVSFVTEGVTERGVAEKDLEKTLDAELFDPDLRNASASRAA